MLWIASLPYRGMAGLGLAPVVAAWVARERDKWAGRKVTALNIAMDPQKMMLKKREMG